jgi:hypothetical protein
MREINQGWESSIQNFRRTNVATSSSLILIAFGAILAFAVSYTVAGVNIQTIGAILMVVGGIGLAIAVATLVGYAPWSTNRGSGTPAVRTTTTSVDPVNTPPTNVQ